MTSILFKCFVAVTVVRCRLCYVTCTLRTQNGSMAVRVGLN